ncbi:MAG: hypothetical protein OK455_07130 [Thaumarchaeota archaeon]|nr:hypothetical protein [Nitrososphaerota archaeon]
MSEAGTSGIPSQPDVAPSPLPPPQNGEAKDQSPPWIGALKTVAFVLAIQLFALYITRVNAPTIVTSGISYQPAGTSSSGSIYNVLILVVVVIASTLAALWLARKRKLKVFLAVVFVGTAVALFLLTLLSAIDVTSGFLDAFSSLYLSIGCACATVVVLALVTLRKIPSWSSLILTGLLSAEVGSYFASTIPILTALILPVAFSLYDIYTVFRGPLKSLITTIPEESLSAISSHIGDFSLGTGDTVFYAMLPALAYFQFTLSSAFVTLIAVDVGVFLTLYLLARVRLLPGLPIPMFLGLAVLLFFFVA